MPTRGSPSASVRASGCSATQSSRSWASLPSRSGSFTEATPPDSPNPRGSQVSTL